MPKAVELITGYVTAAGTTLTDLTMAAQNSLTIRNTAIDANIRLLQAWVDSQGSGILRIKSPQFHDNVQGLRLGHLASDVEPLLPGGISQELKTQDTLSVQLSGSATAGDIDTACLLISYDDLPGIAGNFIGAAALRERLVDLVTVENTLALGTSGGYSGEEAIDAEYDLLHANTDYAILGYIVSVECACIRYRGSDFSPLGLGGPGNETAPLMTANWFVTMSETHDEELIPVFNSANKGSVLLDGAQDENGTDVVVQTILGELS